jgi:hypothetical protein
MAKRKHHRRRLRLGNTHRRRHNPTVRHHRRSHSMVRFHRRRRNPEGINTGNLIPVGAGTVGGYFVARILPASISALAQYNTGLTGYLLNGATGFGLYMLVKRWNRQAANGVLLGTGLAIAVRAYETYMVPSTPAAVTPAAPAAMSGDLGYYISESFPTRNSLSAGPYKGFYGTPRGGGPFMPTGATAVAAGQAAAQAALPPAGGTSMSGPDRWDSVWG